MIPSNHNKQESKHKPNLDPSLSIVIQSNQDKTSCPGPNNALVAQVVLRKSLQLIPVVSHRKAEQQFYFGVTTDRERLKRFSNI